MELPCQRVCGVGWGAMRGVDLEMLCLVCLVVPARTADPMGAWDPVCSRLTLNHQCLAQCLSQSKPSGSFENKFMNEFSVPGAPSSSS